MISSNVYFSVLFYQFILWVYDEQPRGRHLKPSREQRGLGRHPTYTREPASSFARILSFLCLLHSMP